MRELAHALLCAAALVAVPATAGTAHTPPWVVRSNHFTQQLLDVEFRHDPEDGSSEGLTRYDTLISRPTLADQQAERKELLAVLRRLKAQQARERDPRVLEDLEILRKAFDLRFRRQDYEQAHLVPFLNADALVFGGLRVLLNEQVSAARRRAALTRLRKYAGLEPGTPPFVELLKQRTLRQIARPETIYPSKAQLEMELGRNANFVEGIAELFRKYEIPGWEAPYAKLKADLIQYDEWLRTTLLPKARTDFRLPPDYYALALEGFGVDISPQQLAAQAHAAYREIQEQMSELAARIARERGLPDPDYRAVIALLKKQQVTGDAILPLYRARLQQIEGIISAQRLVSLPARPAFIRLASAAETAQQPAPYMSPPAFLNNHGERGEFVLPLNLPAAADGSQDRYDDFTLDAVSWTMTAHEARPGHELQFAAMLENGVSLARVLYAFNSTNAEGWGLYAEYLMQPYEPPEAQLFTLQLRLLRAARAFLDPELQAGKATPAQAYEMLEMDVGLSHAFATEEVERFTYRMPGQANSYFYGYTRLLSLRQETAAELGAKFNPMKFHDFILQQGLLPPDLLRKAVRDEFVPAQR